MIEEMQLRGYAPSTIEGYIHAVAQLARHFRRSPDKLEEDEVRRYLLHLTLEKKIARGSFSVVLGGLRFFYHKALGREWKSLYVAKPPAELRPLARSHQRTVYDLLLSQAAAALQHLADNPRWVGAKLGILAVLHT